MNQEPVKDSAFHSNKTTSEREVRRPSFFSHLRLSAIYTTLASLTPHHTTLATHRANLILLAETLLPLVADAQSAEHKEHTHPVFSHVARGPSAPAREPHQHIHTINAGLLI